MKSFGSYSLLEPERRRPGAVGAGKADLAVERGVAVVGPEEVLRRGGDLVVVEALVGPVLDRRHAAAVAAGLDPARHAAFEVDPLAPFEFERLRGVGEYLAVDIVRQGRIAAHHLAAGGGEIPRLTQPVRPHRAWRYLVEITRVGIQHAGLVRRQAGHEACPRGAADRDLRIGAVKGGGLGADPVEIGGLQGRPEDGAVVPDRDHVVETDENEVLPVGSQGTLLWPGAAARAQGAPDRG